ncbi:hypothetical protein SHKM778_46200 [Streptomyces sp. KM77-8]|uniref:Uncharacterized protein n=1 Tax=Streptomyces haneummycinicus TaxID=3074435 RepID=A0AAT9HL17_9ACTN
MRGVPAAYRPAGGEGWQGGDRDQAQVRMSAAAPAGEVGNDGVSETQFGQEYGGVPVGDSGVEDRPDR